MSIDLNNCHKGLTSNLKRGIISVRKRARVDDWACLENR